MEQQLYSLELNWFSGEDERFELVAGFFIAEHFSYVHFADGKTIGIKTTDIDRYTLTPVKRLDPSAS